MLLIHNILIWPQRLALWIILQECFDQLNSAFYWRLLLSSPSTHGCQLQLDVALHGPVVCCTPGSWAVSAESVPAVWQPSWLRSQHDLPTSMTSRPLLLLPLLHTFRFCIIR